MRLTLFLSFSTGLSIPLAALLAANAMPGRVVAARCRRMSTASRYETMPATCLCLSLSSRLADYTPFASDMLNFFGILFVYASWLTKINSSLRHLICIPRKFSSEPSAVLNIFCSSPKTIQFLHLCYQLQVHHQHKL
jgi:hypothetical protein